MRLVHLIALALVLAACATPTATPAGPGQAATSNPSAQLFSDDFSQDNGLWEVFTEENASAQIINGQLSLSVAAPDSVVVSVLALTVTDFDLTLTATFNAGDPANSYGLIFRYLDNANFYRLDLTGDGLRSISRRAQEQWVALTDLQANPAIQTGPGASNTIRLTGQADLFTVYANNTLLGSVSDNNLPAGRLGVCASTFDDPTMQVSFDAINITKP
jgi:hypothetical protein